LSRRAVAVRIAGQEYRIRSDADEAWLQQVAGHVDETMSRIRHRTGTVDSLDVAVLAALNIARELLEGREELARAVAQTPDRERLRELIELAESGLEDTAEACDAPG
jgi:cell division protein ZapA